LRRVAVTTMASSSWAPPGWDRDSSAWLVACARAETGKASNVATYADAIRRLAMRIPSQGLPVKHESVPGYCKAGRVVSTLTHDCVNIFSLRGNRFWIRGLLLHCDNPQASGSARAGAPDTHACVRHGARDSMGTHAGDV